MLSRLAAPHGNAVRSLAFILAVGLAGQSASAQVDENDRLARCENNRQAIAARENAITASGNWSEETIARARTATQSIRRYYYESSFPNNLHYYQNVERDPARRAELESRLEITGRPLIEIARLFGLSCVPRDFRCIEDLLPSIQRGIDRSVAAQPAIAQTRQQIAAYRTNMAALRCDQAVNTTFTLAGTWRGSNGLSYEMGQSGNTIGWRVNNISETGRGSISGRSVMATWNGNWGPGSATGTVSVGPGGVANRIDWNNGVVFNR